MTYLKKIKIKNKSLHHCISPLPHKTDQLLKFKKEHQEGALEILFCQILAAHLLPLLTAAFVKIYIYTFSLKWAFCFLFCSSLNLDPVFAFNFILSLWKTYSSGGMLCKIHSCCLIFTFSACGSDQSERNLKKKKNITLEARSSSLRPALATAWHLADGLQSVLTCKMECKHKVNRMDHYTSVWNPSPHRRRCYRASSDAGCPGACTPTIPVHFSFVRSFLPQLCIMHLWYAVQSLGARLQLWTRSHT